jgi:hypothetical protein
MLIESAMKHWDDSSTASVDKSFSFGMVQALLLLANPYIHSVETVSRCQTDVDPDKAEPGG